MSRLWYEQSASEWEEALPIGNGRLGAMVYGGTDAERIQLNEESMWYGGRVDRINPDFKENLPLIREYLDQGQIAGAEQLMDKAMTGCPDSMHPYQTLGEINFTFYGIDRQGVTDYTRTLDLDRAVARTERNFCLSSGGLYHYAVYGGGVRYGRFHHQNAPGKVFRRREAMRGGLY